jgi:hypothetical protein
MSVDFLATRQGSSIGTHGWFGEPVAHIIFFHQMDVLEKIDLTPHVIQIQIR